MNKRSPEPTQPIAETTLSAGAEEALFNRFLRRLGQAGHSAIAGAEPAVGVVAEAVQNAATLILEAADRTANTVINTVTPATLTFTAELSRMIVDGRRSRSDIVQVLFRLPVEIRDEIKRISIDEKRQMDELLTEAVLDLLIKHRRPMEVLGTTYESLAKDKITKP